MSSSGRRPVIAAKAALHCTTSRVSPAVTRLMIIPTGALMNALSNSACAAASSRLTCSRSVTSSDTPPMPVTVPSASRIGNFSVQKCRGTSDPATGWLRSKLQGAPLSST